MADPVSWLQIEKGWTVVASGGEELGSVSELTGDRDVDIFDGLSVKFHSGPIRYVPAEEVGEIVPGTVKLTLDAAAAERLEPFEQPPPELVISAEKAPMGARLRSWFGLDRR